MDINVRVNTKNMCNTSSIEEGAIYEFTSYGFAEGTYDASVTFSCMPAAVDDNALEVIIDVVNILKDIKDYGEVLIFFYSVSKGLKRFLNKCHGYYKTIVVESDNSLYEEINVPDDVSEEELQAKIISIMEIERIKMASNVNDIMTDMYNK